MRRGGGGARGALFALVALFSLLAVGADGAALRVGHRLAVQGPVPVAVLPLGQAYLRGVACVARIALLSLDALLALFAFIAFLALVALVAFLPVVDDDRLGAQEADGVAHLFPTLQVRGNGSNIVGCIDELLQRLEVMVHLALPLLEGGEALFVVVHRVPQGGVVIVIGTCGE